MGAYSRDRICIAVGCDDSGRSLAVRAGLGKLSKSRCWDAYGGHIARGATLVHDMENSHSVLVERLGLTSVAYRSADLKGLDDTHNPLSRVNHMHFLLKEFMHRHSGFERDRIDDWLNLFSVIVNPPGDRLEKAALVLDRPDRGVRREGRGRLDTGDAPGLDQQPVVGPPAHARHEAGGRVRRSPAGIGVEVEQVGAQRQAVGNSSHADGEAGTGTEMGSAAADRPGAGSRRATSRTVSRSQRSEAAPCVTSCQSW